MKYYTELNLDGLEYDVYKQPRKNVSYVNIESAFDIETTSMVVDGEKTSFMYIWMIGIGHGNDVYYGRTWEEFVNCCNLISKGLRLSCEKRLVVYVHNLAYEFQFMRKYFTWVDDFNIDDRKPLKITSDIGFEFRDSYLLSGYDLDNTAKNLVSHRIEKLNGNLDYNLTRTSQTPLSEDELSYCKNDIDIITAYIKEQLKIYGDVTKLPLTNTARVRKFVRNNCYYDNSSHKKSSKWKYLKYRAIMDELTLTSKEYYLLKGAFQGGFTHSNPHHTGKTLDDVSSIDFVSSYPAVMLSEKFPMGKGKEVSVGSMDELRDYMSRYGVLFRVKFTDIYSTISQENYISESKCTVLENQLTSNGRVYRAGTLEMIVTNIDFKIIEKTYNWSQIAVSDVIVYPMGYLPKAIITSIIELYQAKTTLKGIKGKEAEYLHSKGMLNSIYGMTVTDIVRTQVNYDSGEWTSLPPIIRDEIDKYNESKNRFLFYPWGVWITAYARRNLWTGILALGNDYVYSDTDSLKFTNYEDNLPYINNYNMIMKRKLEAMCKVYKLDPQLMSPANSDGEVKTIGLWDYEGTYDKFKTLGAKRYLYQEGSYTELTVAGVGKRSAMDYMLSQCDTIEGVFDMFGDDLYIPAEHTGKLTHTYIDRPRTLLVEDYLGVITEVTTLSGIHLEGVEYSLSVASEYVEFINSLKQGYIFKGVRAING